jgi:hypothetical protein
LIFYISFHVSKNFSYINQLPALLRTQPIEEVPSTDTRRFAQSINCLLYADDVVLIAAPQDLAILLQQCKDHSHRLGYRWNPLKCAILAPSSDTQAYSLYGTAIPHQGIFSYLGIPINPGGYLNTAQLIQDNVNKALQTMNQMTTIGVNNKGFDRLLSVVFEDIFSFSSPLLSLFSLLTSKRFLVSFILPFDLIRAIQYSYYYVLTWVIAK